MQMNGISKTDTNARFAAVSKMRKDVDFMRHQQLLQEKTDRDLAMPLEYTADTEVKL